MSRSATIRTTHDDPDLVARALRPDNTDEMETTIERTGGRDAEEADTVVTRIERETTGGLHSNVDDYIVNLAVATDVAQSGQTVQSPEPTDTGPVSDTDNDTPQHNE
ncbi:KEOPS complex subunit Pcc1 [Natrialbaceae archaeon A-arb3/5]